jgi:hypothetical protein
MNAEQWKADYEAAFKTANGTTAKVVEIEPGWYRIERADGDNSQNKYRRSAMLEMTANLERRIKDEGAKA